MLFTLNSALYRKYRSRQSLVTGNLTINWFFLLKRKLKSNWSSHISLIISKLMEDLPWKVYTLSLKIHISLEKMKGIFNSKNLLLRTNDNSKNITDLEKSTHDGGPDKSTTNQSIYPSIRLPLSFLILHWLAHFIQNTHVHSTHINPPKARYMLFSQHGKHICRI